MKRLILLAIIFAIVGCSRHVVVLPEEVSQRNNPDWIIKAEHAKTGIDQKK